MSIALIVEVMDHAPESLTHREHKVLMVLAEDCRDDRKTRHAPDSEYMLRRARLSRHQMYATIKALIAKGALERAVTGGHGHRAVYHIPPLRQENPDPGCVRETPTQEEEAASGKTERCVGKNGALRQENPDAYTPVPSFTVDQPGGPASQPDPGTGAGPRDPVQAVTAPGGAHRPPRPPVAPSGTPPPAGTRKPSTRPVVLDVQQISNAPPLQSQATDRYARAGGGGAPEQDQKTQREGKTGMSADTSPPAGGWRELEHRRSCIVCTEEHPPCRFASGSLWCVIKDCANPHHRAPLAEVLALDAYRPAGLAPTGTGAW